MTVQPYDLQKSDGTVVSIFPLETDGGAAVPREIIGMFRYEFESFTIVPQDIFTLPPTYGDRTNDFLIGTYFSVINSGGTSLDGVYVVDTPGPTFDSVRTHIPVVPIGHVVGAFTTPGTTSILKIAGDLRYRLNSILGFSIDVFNSAGAANGYQELNFSANATWIATPVINRTNLLTNFVVSTIYTITVTVDGGAPQVVNVLGANAPNFNALLVQINSQLSGAMATLTSTGLRIVSNSIDATSTVVIVDGGMYAFLITQYPGTVLDPSVAGASGQNDGTYTVAFTAIPAASYAQLSIFDATRGQAVTSIPLVEELPSPFASGVSLPVPYGYLTYTPPQQTSLEMPGKGATGWGFSYDQDFLRLMENFATTSIMTPNGPIDPINGQLWYETDSVGPTNLTTTSTSRLFICSDQTIPEWTEVGLVNASSPFLFQHGDTLADASAVDAAPSTPRAFDSDRLYYSSVNAFDPTLFPLRDGDPNVLVTKSYVDAAASAGTIQPIYQVIIGTGVGNTADPNFTYVYTVPVVANIGQLFVNTTTGTVGSVSSPTPASVAIFGVNGTGVGGGTLTLQAGTGDGANQGGSSTFMGGTGGATGVGGSSLVQGGTGGATSGAGGQALLVGGNAVGAGSTGGMAAVYGGTPVDGNGGAVTIVAANGVGANRDGGAVTIVAGTATGVGTNGVVTITGGNGDQIQVGASINITGVAGSPGSPINVTGGGSTTGTAGSINLTGGTATGAGVAGNIVLTAGTTTGGTNGFINLKSGTTNNITTANSGAAYTIDPYKGNFFNITLTANTTFTFGTVPASPNGVEFLLQVTQDATGGRTITWPGSVVWVGGQAPNFGKVGGIILDKTLFRFVTFNGGTTWVGRKLTDNTPRIKTVTYAAAVTLDWSDADIIRITLTGNIIINMATTATTGAAIDGQRCILQLFQGGVGSYTVGFGAEVQFGTDITSYTPSTAVGDYDYIGFFYNTTNPVSGPQTVYNVMALTRGYA